MKKEEFETLIERLKYWNESEEGINSHGTDGPIFDVQEKVRIYGLDSGYSDYFEFGKGETYFDSISDFLESIDDEEELEIINQCWGKYFDQKPVRLKDFPEDTLIKFLGDCCDYQKVYYKEDWKHVNTHLTREAAQTFIDRKKHDYTELRIWVSSLYWCWEFKDLIEGLVNGDIILKTE